MQNVILGQALFKLGIDPSGVSTQLSKLSGGFTNLNQDLFRTSMVMGGLTASFAGLTMAIGKFAYDYEMNMAIVKSVTNASKEEYDAMGKAARDMGQVTSYGAAKAAEGLITLARMGLNAGDSMRVLAPAMKLAQGQQVDMAVTTEMLVKQLKSFGENLDQADRYANVLAATASQTAADMTGLQFALSYAGPVAKVAGVQFEELNTALGLVFNAGIRASRAGTDLRYVMATLVGATDGGKKALKSIGLTMDDIAPQTHSLGEIFKTLAKHLEPVQNKAQVIFDIFGKRAATSVSAIMSALYKNANAWDDLKYSITGTSEVQRQYEQQMNTWPGQIQLIKSNIEELSLEFKDALMPVIVMATSGFRSLIEYMKSLSPETKMAIGSFALVTAGVSALGFGVVTLGYAFATITQAMSKVSGLFGAIGSQLRLQAASVAAGNAAYTQLGVAISGKVVPALIQEELVRAGLSKYVASSIAQHAIEATAMETNNIARLKQIQSIVLSDAAYAKQSLSMGLANAAAITGTASYLALGTALDSKLVPALLKEELIRSGLSKQVANGMVQYAMESTAMETDHIVRLKTIDALLVESARKKGVTIATDRLTASVAAGTVGLAEYNAMLAKGALTSKVATVDANRLNASMIAGTVGATGYGLAVGRTAAQIGMLGKIARVAWGLVGGWVGIAIAGTIALGTAIASSVAKTRAFKKASAEMTTQYGDQAQKIFDLETQYANLNATEEVSVEKDEKLLQLNRFLNKEKAALVAMNPMLVSAYNVETGEITLQGGAIRNLITDMQALRKEKANINSEGNVGDPYKENFLGKKVMISGMNITQLEEQMAVEIEQVDFYTSKIDEMFATYGKGLGLTKEGFAQLAELMKNVQDEALKGNETFGGDRKEGIGSAYSDAAQFVKMMSGGKIKTTEEFRQATVGLGTDLGNTSKQIAYANALLILMKEKLVAMKTAVEPVTEVIKELGDGAEDAATRGMHDFDAWARAIREFNEALADSRNWSLSRLVNEDPEIIQKMTRIRQDYTKKIEENARAFEKVTDAQKEAADWVANNSTAKHPQGFSQKEWDANAAKQKESLKKLGEEKVQLEKDMFTNMKENWKEYSKETQKFNYDTKSEIIDLQADTSRAYIGGLKFEIAAIRRAGKDKIMIIDKQCEEQIKLMNMIMERTELSEEEKLKLYSNEYIKWHALQTLKGEIAANTDEKVKQSTISSVNAGIDAINALENAGRVSNLRKLENDKKAAEEKLKQYTADTLAFKQATAEKLNADEAFRQAIGAEVNKTISMMFDFGELLGGENLEVFENLTTSISSLVESLGDGDFNLEDINSIIGLVFDILQGILDLLETSYEADSIKAKATAEYNERVREANIALESMKDATDELRESFVVFARDVLGMSSSTEGAADMITELKDELLALVPTLHSGEMKYLPELAKNRIQNDEFAGNKTPQYIKDFVAYFEENAATNDSVIQYIMDTLPQDIRDAMSTGDFGTFTEYMRGLGLVSSADNEDSSLVVPGGPVRRSAAPAASTPDPETMSIGLDDWTTFTRSLGEIFGAQLVQQLQAKLYGGLTADPDKLLDELIGIKDGFDDVLANGSDQLKALLKWEDYAKVIDMIYKEELSRATTPEEVEAAVLKRIMGYKAIQNNDQLWAQVPQEEKFNFSEMMKPTNINKEVADGIKAMEERYSPITDAANLIVEAFQDGTITQQEAIDQMKRLVDSIGDMPGWLDDILAEATDIVVTGKKAERGTPEEAEDQLDQIRSGAEDYKSDMAGLDKEMKDIIDGWNGLLTERQDIIDKYGEDYDKITDDSKKRIDALNEERSAVLGTFDFSETQNKRSQRFAKARELEKDILDEIVSTQDALKNLEKEYLDSLGKVNAKISELETKWGTIDAVYTAYADKRAAREQEFIAFLKEESAILDGIIGQSMSLMSIFSGAGLEGLLKGISDIKGQIPGIMADTSGAPSAGLKPVLKSVDDAIAAAQPQTATVPLQLNKIEEFATGVGTGAQPMVESLMDLIKSWMPSGGVFGAANGFSGIVTKPTAFMTGEGGKPEMVNISPLDGLNGSGMASQGKVNLMINETIDMRGAYGITSPAVAEEVYRKVWAPARRRVVDSYANSMGKVIR